LETDLILEYGKAYAFKRYTLPKSAKGQAVMPVEVPLDPATGLPWQMNASVQDLKGYEVLALPEGLRNRDIQRVYTGTALQVADEAEKVVGDRFNYKGKLYETVKREDWVDTDLPFFKFLAAKVEHS
jgi:hypothetical protein